MVENVAVGDNPPLGNAAGTVKTTEQALTLVAAGMPRIVLGSYTWEARDGNQGSTYFETPLASLNSLGLPSPAPSDWAHTVTSVVEASAGAEVSVSVAGFTVSEFERLTTVAFEAGAHSVELNLGCPNVWDDGTQKRIFSFDPEIVDNVLSSVAEALGGLDRVGVKLSPIFDSHLMAELDEVLVRRRVAFVTTMNTLPNCLALDPNHRPEISVAGGLAGMSGAAVKWVALGQVAMHRSLMPNARIIGVGGIATGRDLADMLSVGADECQIATALWHRGPRAYVEILSEYVELPIDEPSS